MTLKSVSAAVAAMGTVQIGKILFFPAKAFCTFGCVILNSSECCVAGCGVVGLCGSMCRKILGLSFHGRFAK